jgi:hypothetical protein
VAQLRDRKRSLKKAIRICVEKHKRIYCQQLVVVATTNRDFNLRRLAMGLLAKGDDMTHEVPKRRQDVAPEAFKIHLENLFRKESLGETLGLTADQVGPKSAPNMELSRPPTLPEVQLAIGRLQDGTAPGANALRPESFKAGGAILAHRLQQDFGVIWPAVSPGPDLNPEPNLRTDDTGGDPPKSAGGTVAKPTCQGLPSLAGCGSYHFVHR